MRRLLPLILTGALVACGDKEDGAGDASDAGGEVVDADGDGFAVDDDCDDADPTRNPGAAELCDGVDNDCTGVVDDTPVDGTLYYSDEDGDGHGTTTATLVACALPEGFAPASGDCDDADDAVHPGAAELCDGLDNDCDAEVDEDATVFYADEDGDGYGDPAVELSACERPEGAVENAEDCDDSTAAVAPGLNEICDGLDNDCDGVTDPFVQVPTDHATISAAIAAVDPGSEICILPGTYAEALDLGGKDVDLTGAGTRAEVVVDAGGAGSVLTLQAGESAVVTRLTLMGAASGGVRVVNAALELVDVSVEDNLVGTGSGGGGIYAESSILELVDSALTNNQAVGDGLAGGGLFALDSLVRVASSTIRENGVTGESAEGGGVSVRGGAVDLVEVQVEANTIAHTGAGGGLRGGGLHSDGTALTIEGGSVSDNTLLMDSTSYGYADGGGLFLDGGVVSIEGLVLAGNQLDATCEGFCYGEGGGLAFRGDSGAGDSLVLSDVEAGNNEATVISQTSFAYVYGGGMSLGGEVDVILDFVQLWDNVGSATGTLFAHSYGAGLSAYDARIAASHLDLRGNSLLGSDEAHGGVISLEWAAMELTASVVAGNQVDVDGDVSGGVLLAHWDDQGWYPDRPEGHDVVLRNVDLVGTTVAGDEVFGGVVHQEWASRVLLENTNIVGTVLSASAVDGAILFAEAEAGAPSVSYVNLWDNSTAAADWSGDEGAFTVTGLLSLDPAYVATDAAEASGWDLHLSSGSAAIDAGNPEILDDDGSTSDLGAHGGPGGSLW